LLYFTHLSRSPQWMDFYQIWYRRSPRGRNQLCRIFCRSVQGYWFCGGLKFAHPYRNWRSPLTLSELLWCQWTVCFSVHKLCMCWELSRRARDMDDTALWTIPFYYRRKADQCFQCLVGLHQCRLSTENRRICPTKSAKSTRNHQTFRLSLNRVVKQTINCFSMLYYTTDRKHVGLLYDLIPLPLVHSL